MYRIGVTESGWDDVGQILRNLEIPFDEISVHSFKAYDNIKEYSTIFINCSRPASSFNWKKVSENVRNFVFKGGTIYASDLAAALIGTVFPGVLSFGTVKNQGKFLAKTVDENLLSTIGKEIELEYDSVVYSVPQISSSVKVYLKVGDDNVVTSFRHGDGEVIYTTFHNHIQPSKQEQEFLRFLVLLPILSKTERESNNQLEAENFKSTTQVFNTSKLSNDRDYMYVVETSKPVRFMLNWSGKAKLRLSVYRPDGSLMEERENSDPPISITVQNPEIGR